jgi:hypothetical protein
MPSILRVNPMKSWFSFSPFPPLYWGLIPDCHWSFLEHFSYDYSSMLIDPVISPLLWDSHCIYCYGLFSLSWDPTAKNPQVLSVVFIEKSFDCFHFLVESERNL